MFEWQKEIKDGMLLMVSKNRGYIEATHRILRYIHGIYIGKSSHLYTEKELFWVNHFLDSIIYKSFLVRVAVEQLQSVRHGRINESLWPAIENSLVTLDCSDDEQVLVSFALESFLFEARSFLDIYMVFVCLLLKTGFTNGKMNRSRFIGELSNVIEPAFAPKAKWIKQYFDTHVFGKEENKNTSFIRKDWGILLSSLRDKVTHRDVIGLSFESKEEFIDNIRLDWPTINELTYHSLAETIGNGIHALFHQGLCHIYELKWDDYQRIAQDIT
ncbi:MAG: hypothetical protein ACYC3P_05200 [Bellilinea sp.]